MDSAETTVANVSNADAGIAPQGPNDPFEATESTAASVNGPGTVETCSLEGIPPANDVEIVAYSTELQLPDIMRLISSELSEPYSIYTYRYFIHNWPQLSFLAMRGERCVGTIVCKLASHKSGPFRGYIAMLAVDQSCRKRRIGTRLVKRAIEAMIASGADEVVLETEVTNLHAIALYERLGFARDKMLFRYYLNGVDAIRLKLWLK